MQPPLLKPASRNYVPIYSSVPTFEAISEEDKFNHFRNVEDRFKKDKNDSNYISMLSIYLYAGEFEKMKQAIDENINQFKDLSVVFSAHYLNNKGKFVKSALLLERFLKNYMFSSEAMFLAAKVQMEMATPIPLSTNFGVIALLHYLRGNYDLALKTYSKLPLDCRCEWIELLIKVAQEGFNPALVNLMSTCNMPRCAIISLLSSSKECEVLSELAESKLMLMPYDFMLRESLMAYYMNAGNRSMAEYHFDLYTLGKAPYSDNFFVTATFKIRLGKMAEAKKIVDTHVPLSPSCYAKVFALYEMIPDSGEMLEKRLEEALAHSPKSISFLRVYCNFLENNNRDSECEEVTNRILKINPLDQGALVRKVASATTFKTGKKYLSVLEENYPDDNSTLSIGVAVRYEFGEEIKKALHDVEVLRKGKEDIIYEKLYSDILIYLERYEELLIVADSVPRKFYLIYYFRKIISFLRLNRIEEAAQYLKQYELLTPLGEQERLIKGELLVSQRKYEEAYPYFSEIKLREVHLSHKTVRAFFKCLKELNKGDEATKLFDQIMESTRGFYGEYADWINTLPKQISRSKTNKKIPNAVPSTFIGSKQDKKEERNEELVMPSENSISLLRGTFSAANTIGVDPLYRKSPKEKANEISKRCLIEPYPVEFIEALDDAIKSLFTLTACLLQPFPSMGEIGYHVVNYLSRLHSHPDAVSFISSRVIDFESLRHSFDVMCRYPYLITTSSISQFAEESKRLAKALEESKKRYANVMELNASPIIDPVNFEKNDRAKKILLILVFIKSKLDFLINSKFNFLDFDDDRETKIIVLAMWNIRAAIRAMYRYDVDKANALRSLFPEFQKEFKSSCYPQTELDGINFEMAAYIYLSAKIRMSEIDKLK